MNYTITDNCIVLSSSSGNRYPSLKVNGQSTGYVDITKDYCIELEMKCDSYCTFAFGGSSFVISRYVQGDTLKKVKIEFKNAVGKLYIDDSYIAGADSSMTANSDCSVRVNENATVTLRNFKVYPI